MTRSRQERLKHVGDVRQVAGIEPRLEQAVCLRDAKAALPQFTLWKQGRGVHGLAGAA